MGTLSIQEEKLVKVVRESPPRLANEVVDFAEFLKEKNSLRGRARENAKSSMNRRQIVTSLMGKYKGCFSGTEDFITKKVIEKKLEEGKFERGKN